jgi:fructokinase
VKAYGLFVHGRSGDSFMRTNYPTFTENAPLVTVIGEALIDFIPIGAPNEYRAQPGGSPFNVAIGLARLGNRIQLMARLADNTFGQILRARATAENIDLSLAPHALEPTSLAFVSFDGDARARYDFYFDGAADWQWTAYEIGRLSSETAVLHFGSLASWTPPGSEPIRAAVAERHAAGQTLISYDPNVRPAIMDDVARSRRAIEACVACAHIAKASRDDVEWLYPEVDVEYAARRWLGLGAVVVVVTDGSKGAHVFRADGESIQRPARLTQVVDTVGAGDAFTAGMLNALVGRGMILPRSISALSTDLLVDIIDEAVLVSSLTCESAGATPPWALRQPNRQEGERLAPDDLQVKRE